MDLQGVRAKLDRANGHTLELQIAIDTLFDTNQECFRIEVDSQDLSTKFIPRPFPKSISGGASLLETY